MRVGGLLFGAPDGGSFVSAGAAGLNRAAADCGAALTLRYCTETTEAGRIETLSALARSGVDLVVVHGGQGDAPVRVVAPEFPHVMFAVAQGGIVGANIASYEVALEEAAFLAGAFAALTSRTGTVAHLSGERVRPGLKGRAAFTAGARHVRPDVRVLTSFCGEQHDAALAGRYAAAQIACGADVLFTMLGTGRAGAIEACRRSGAKQIGDGIDWCAVEPAVFIAAAFADVGWGAARAIADFAQGEFPAGRHRSIGLAQPAFCRLIVAPETDAARRGTIARLAGAIVAGSIPMPEATQPIPEFTL